MGQKVALQERWRSAAISRRHAQGGAAGVSGRSSCVWSDRCASGSCKSITADREPKLVRPRYVCGRGAQRAVGTPRRLGISGSFPKTRTRPDLSLAMPKPMIGTFFTTAGVAYRVYENDRFGLDVTGG